MAKQNGGGQGLDFSSWVPGERIPGTYYIVLALFDEGGHGRLSQVRHEITGRVCVFKAVHRKYKAMGDFAERLQQEAQINTRLSGHPNVAEVFEAGVTGDDRTFCVMQWLEGKNLRSVLKQGRGLDVEEACFVAASVLGALARAHRLGIVHRDVKPENIFLCDDGFVKLIDFGVAKVLDSTFIQTGRGMMPGTIRYMSPEAVDGKKAALAMDIYSLGVVFWEMLAGEHPFPQVNRQDATQAIVLDGVRPLDQRPIAVAKTTAALRQVIMRACALKAADRFPSAEAFGEAIDLARGYARSTRPLAAGVCPPSYVGEGPSPRPRSAPVVGSAPLRAPPSGAVPEHPPGTALEEGDPTPRVALPGPAARSHVVDQGQAAGRRAVPPAAHRSSVLVRGSNPLPPPAPWLAKPSGTTSERLAKPAGTTFRPSAKRVGVRRAEPSSALALSATRVGSRRTNPQLDAPPGERHVAEGRPSSRRRRSGTTPKRVGAPAPQLEGAWAPREGRNRKGPRPPSGPRLLPKGGLEPGFLGSRAGRAVDDIMWKLTIEDDEGATRELDLVRDGYAIGRDGTCDVFLPERNVSRRHARLERDAEGRWWLIDLGAPYGSFLNGHRVAERAAFSPGDIAQVGDHWLGLVDDEPAAESDRGGAPSQKPPSTPWDVRAEPDRVLVFGGPDNGRRVRVDAGPVSIGVGAGVTIRLPEGAAPAGVHALLRPLPQGQYEVVRRGPALFLNVRLQRAERSRLDDGDLVLFEGPDGAEVLALRFLVARQVRHSTRTAFAATGQGSGLGGGQRLEPSSLPTREAVEATLQGLPLWWRLEGESVWPRPAGYQAPPVRFTDVTGERAEASTLPPPPPLLLTEPPPPRLPGSRSLASAPPRERVRRGARWAAVALLVVAGGWALGRRGNVAEAVADGVALPASAPLVAAAAPPAADVTDVADVKRASPKTAESDGAGPADAALAEPPAPNRVSTAAVRSPGSLRVGAPLRRPEAAAPERRRGLCRTYAASIARGDASPEIIQVHRAHCL